MKSELINFLKGILIGIANVIPGVSGGTIALITGILERLLNVIKHVLSIKSITLFFTGKFNEWARYVDLKFAISVFFGIVVAIISIARLFEYLFKYYPIYIWAFFFGLVLASVYFVVKTVSKFNIFVVLLFLIGSAIAVGIALLHPATENSDVFYLFICGIIAAASMILPGISGSFVLVLMGNYELIMIRSINHFNINVLLPVAIGAAIGILVLSYILSWLFKNFPDYIIAILSGFMLGSLLTIWPWKETIWKTNNFGQYVLTLNGNKIVEKYNWFFPQQFNLEVLMAVLFIFLGIGIVWFLEYTVSKKNKPV